MSTSLSIASVIEKNRLSSDVPWLVCLDIDVIDPASLTLVETIHIVRNTEAITFNGFNYTPANFDIELKSESGAQSSVNVSINDYSLAIQKRMQSYGGGVGFKVAIIVVNGGALTQPAEIVEYFEVVGASAGNYACTFMLGAENNLTKAFPRRRQMRDYCQWRFKSAECGYTGAMPTCDLSLQGPNGCGAHNNVVRFGAYPGLSNRDTRYG